MRDLQIHPEVNVFEAFIAEAFPSASGHQVRDAWEWMLQEEWFRLDEPLKVIAGLSSSEFKLEAAKAIFQSAIQMKAGRVPYNCGWTYCEDFLLAVLEAGQYIAEHDESHKEDRDRLIPAFKVVAWKAFGKKRREVREQIRAARLDHQRAAERS